MSDAWTDARLLTKEEVAEIEARKAASKQAAMQSPGTITKHMRVSIDFHITIAGTPPDDDGMNDPDLVYHARQQRLLDVVRSTPEALERWMRMLIAQELQVRHWVDVDGGDTSYEELLETALAKMPAEDLAHFQAMTAPGPDRMYWDDVVDLFYASFAITGDAAVVSDIEGHTKGSPIC